MKTKVSCTKILRFSSGHRVYMHESKCRHLHGHNYKAEITVTSKHLDWLGRVIDFSVIKSCIGEWIDRNWDHKTLLFQDDHEYINRVLSTDCFICPFNPTAENMAMYLLKKGNLIFKEQEHPIKVIRVKLWETDTCFAIAE